MAKIIPLFILLFSLSSFALKNFESDNCTLAPDGKWSECCYQHDLYYWVGGTKKHQKRTDKELRSCIQSKSNAFVATIYYYGILIGHLSPIKHKTHWGWGWEKDRKKESFSRKEIYEIRNQMYSQDFTTSQIDKFIKKLPMAF